MSDTPKVGHAYQLYKKLLQLIDGHELTTIGPALSMVLVEIAQSLDMSKEEFIAVMADMWDATPTEDETEVRH